MFRFENPEAFYLLIIIPLMTALWMAGGHYIKKRRAAFGSPHLIHRLIRGSLPVQRSAILWLAAVTLIIIGIANPQMGTKKEKVKVENIDIMIALDISASMNAKDISPSRLEKAKRFIEQLILSRKGDQIGLILFAGAAYLQMPLTHDYAAALLFAKSATTDIAGTQGTVISDAIEMAMSRVKEKNQRALVVISDGEDHDGNAIQMAAKAAANGWNIFTIGAGTSVGSFIPVQIEDREEYLTDEEGNPVKSAINKKLLEEIAEKGQGASYFLENDNTDILKDINVQLAKIQKRAVEVKSFTEFKSYYQSFLVTALLLLIIDFYISSFVRFKSKNPFKI